MKRRRREAPEGEFRDPLSDYSPPSYADEMERSLDEDMVRDIQNQPMAIVEPTMTIEAAMRHMIDLDVACLIVAQGDRLLGIFSERDVLDKVAPDYADMKGRPIRDAMTPNPMIVHDTDSPAKALNIMAVGGFRHVPVLDVDDKLVGILGPRRITRYLQRYFTP